MKVIRTQKLWLQEGGSDQLYEVDLVETGNADPDRSHLVNVRFGKRGQQLREGTRTTFAVSIQQATKIFDSVVVAKINEGYRRVDAEMNNVQPANIPPAAPAHEAAAVPLAARDRVLLDQLDACQRGSWPEKKRDRLFWHIGELRLAAAGPALIRAAQRSGPAQVSYSLAWALARCAGGDAAETLRAVAAQTEQPLVAGLAEFALMSPLMGERRLPVQAGVSMPAGVAAALQRRDADALAGAFADLAQREPARVGPLMVAVYRLAQSDASVGRLLLALIGRITVRPPYLLGLRRIFKYAEMLDDAATFGAVARRFDTATPMYRRTYKYQGTPYVYVTGLPGRQTLSHLHGAADARTGLSIATLTYLKRRIWRALRKRGESGQASFAELATGYLLAFDESDMRKSWTETRYRWRNGQMETRMRHHGPFAHVWSVGQLLYRNAPQVRLQAGSLTFHAPDALTGQERGEAFPALWSARPDCALKLAGESRCEPVAMFGLRFLRDDAAFRRNLDAAALERLLMSPFEPVVRLALEEVRGRFAEGQVTASLVAVLLDARLAEARELGIKRVDLDPDWPWADQRLGFIAMTSAHEDVRQAAARWRSGRQVGADGGAALAEAVAGWLLGLPQTLGEAEVARLDHLRACLAALWPRHDMPIAPETVARLMAHPASHVIALGINAFGLSGADAGAIPELVLQQLLNSPHAEIQAAALGLLNRLGDEQLAARAFLVLSLITAESPRVRQAIRPLAIRLAARFPRIADDISVRLIDRLFQSAPDDAFAEDVVALLAEAAPAQLAALDAGTLWRLLQAKAKGARLLGATVIVARDPSIFSVRQLARLGNHSHAAVRRWVMAAYEAGPQRFSAEAPDAVLLIESEWADAYEFALAYFERWPDATWTPDVLGVVADSTNQKVLAFARSVLRRTLAPGDASEQLSRLLEHPAGSMHLLITEVLTAAAAADDKVFAKVLPLSRIVLLRVHGGRVAKDRVAAFLHAEAMKSAERAAAIAPIFTDLSLSIVERDRAAAVMALRDIGAAYPALAEGSPLKRVALERRAAR